MLNFIEVKNDKLLNILNNLAASIWREYYKPIFGDFQVNYMLESTHNKDKIKQEIANGYKYYILQKDDQNIGYISFVRQDSKYITNGILLNKIYIIKAFRNQGLGKIALDFIINHDTNNDANNIWMMEDKRNIDTIKSLESLGFMCIDEEQKDIGKGYIVNECLMIKQIDKQ